MPKLSILIPAYNIEKYIGECMDSVLAQNMDEVEVIVIEDGSTDHTGQICDAYEKKYGNVTVFHNENGGLSKARNFGIRKAAGDYIIFLDGDDFLAPNAIENILNCIRKNNNVDVIIGRYIMYDLRTEEYETCSYHLNKKVIESSTKEALLNELFDGKTYDWYACLNIVRKAYISDHNLFFKEGACFEDALWTPELLFQAEKLSYIEEPFYIYSQNRAGSITSSVSEKTYQDKQFVCQYAKEFCRKHDLSKELSRKFMGNCNRTYVSLLADSWRFEKKRRKEYWEVQEKYKRILLYSGRQYQRYLYKLWRVIGIRGVSYILHLRAEWVRKRSCF